VKLHQPEKKTSSSSSDINYALAFILLKRSNIAFLLSHHTHTEKTQLEYKVSELMNLINTQKIKELPTLQMCMRNETVQQMN